MMPKMVAPKKCSTYSASAVAREIARAAIQIVNIKFLCKQKFEMIKSESVDGDGVCAEVCASATPFGRNETSNSESGPIHLIQFVFSVFLSDSEV